MNASKKLGKWGLLFFVGTLHLGTARADAVDTGAASDPLLQSYDQEAGGHMKEALAALAQLPPARKDTYLGWLREGWLLYRLGRHAEAVESYRKAITAAPRAVEPRLGILLPQLALHRWADAEKVAKETLQLDPASYLATLRLAFVYYNQHRYAESAALYQKLRELYPGDTDVRSGLSWALLKGGKTADAAREFRELLAINSRLATAREGLQAAGGH
jgi:tetratricopeptide (TPR) repeat protein